MQKVKIDIQAKNAKTYTGTAYNALNHQTGTLIELVNNRVLIKFDFPVKSFFHYGSKHTHFWFNKEDITIISTRNNNEKSIEELLTQN